MFLESFADLRYFPLNEHRDTIDLVKNIVMYLYTFQFCGAFSSGLCQQLTLKTAHILKFNKRAAPLKILNIGRVRRRCFEERSFRE